ncbi:hypothetical protein Scep_024033 [Stephania cephalantha]|uniref:Uncharacterized protein n=1 Tax=Stephania cephalantha TaxID=152367 RepID=A0AAP0HTB7_9MAGN
MLVLENPAEGRRHNDIISEGDENPLSPSPARGGSLATPEGPPPSGGPIKGKIRVAKGATPLTYHNHRAKSRGSDGREGGHPPPPNAWVPKGSAPWQSKSPGTY